MDSQSSSKRTLPNTPRVSDKIMEYYAKYGHGRDLEKFMRLYSPASSQESQNTQDGISSAVNKEHFCATHARSQESICSDCGSTLSIRPLSECCKKSSRSLPNIGVQQQNDGGTYFPAKDMIVDINVQAGDDKKRIINISTESLETPKKNFNGPKTQTPDSVAKSHRRLEWDSLGDIGYQKSMSTSNISVLEKSLLKEFFKEDSVALKPPASTQGKSETIEQHQIIKQTKAEENEHNTPPLASSTLVIPSNKGAKPKKLTKSTSSTSLQEKFEKFAQTSLRKQPTVSTKEVQCSMSCSSNSLLEGTVTPSSFEYVSSRSSRSHSSKSSNAISHTTHNVSQRYHNICEHPFITSITELLIKRKALAEKNHPTQTQFNNIQQVKTNFKSAFDENKENQTHSSVSVCSSNASSFSLAKRAPELDLGIQLICSLIDAKSVNGKQKKRLIRDIVKRLSRLEVNESLSHSSSDNSSAVLYDSVRSCINNKQELFKMAKEKTDSKSNVIPIPIVEEQTNEKKSTTSNSNTSESSKDSNVFKADTEEPNKSNTPDAKRSHPHRMNQNEGHTNKHLISKAKHKKRENISNENHTNVPRLTSRQIEQIKTVQEREACDQPSKMTSETKRKHSTHTETVLKSQQVPSTLSNTSSSSTSQDLTTQKFIGPAKSDLNNSNTDAEQASMREWLNPLTQSEIEYEEKKRNEIKKKEATIQKQKLLKKTKHDCGRVQQLNWIENEIRRLECLKHLLLKDVTTEQSSGNLSSIKLTSPSDKNSSKDSTKTYKLYDTVYSDKSSVLSENAEHLMQEIEIILEESHEDIVNVKDKLKKSKNRTKETQIVFEKHNTSDIISVERKVKPTFRSVKETININEEQVLNGQTSETENKQKCQREKIDTPSTEESQNSESLKEMVQQRKKEFIEAYKTKKQHHYEALKQQQKEHFKYLNIQRKIKERPKPSTSTTTDTDHYSVPLSDIRKLNANNFPYAYTQNPLPLTPSESESLKSKNQDIIYSATANPPPPKRSIFGKQSTVTNPITATTSSSSTSMFCISSDVSVPMGSGNTTSTSTTTHQYDDVAAAAARPGIAIQTSDSMLCTKPIYGTKQTSSFFTPSNIAPATTTTTSNTTAACIQVKPKGIAYVIEFENDKKDSNSNSTSNLDINEKSKAKIPASNRTDDANNVKASSSTNEPQLTLQEHLEKRKPLFLQHSKERKAILNQLQQMRQERDRQIREIINNSSFNSLDKRLKYLPPPPIQKVRILKTKEMKALTNKRFSNLPEVVAKQEHEIEQKKRRSNRILRDVFNRRLQKRVRSGKLSLNHSKTVI